MELVSKGVNQDTRNPIVSYIVMITNMERTAANRVETAVDQSNVTISTVYVLMDVTSVTNYQNALTSVLSDTTVRTVAMVVEIV